MPTAKPDPNLSHLTSTQLEGVRRHHWYSFAVYSRELKRRQWSGQEKPQATPKTK